MEFEDPEVKKYLVANIGGEDGITNPEFGVPGVKGIAGEVTYEQVLACKKVDFQGNRNIRRFNELEYFKNIETAQFERSSIEEVSLPNMTISKGSDFYSCGELKKLTTKYGLKVDYGWSMFQYCTSLQSLDTSKWNLSNLVDVLYMFDGCRSLQTLDTGNWNLSNVNKAGAMFRDCTNLVSIDLSDKLENCKNYAQFLKGCVNLESLVGNHTETDNVRLFIGRSKDINISSLLRINLATINAIIRGVGSSPDKKLTLTLPEPVRSQVTEEYRKILEYKNWEIN
ncbi:leucine-rich repeat protein [Prevotella histicola]|uniref:leucine-rich repeat protein n=1 Tax=Prevotella histicola TaxID=470565 RepID=UPI001CAF70C5|nr:leucine-rich repeat protein [Prevotella histicola]MBF1400171.1 BspA family leucine-rich repeat surface protein [Prevotella histicola]